MIQMDSIQDLRKLEDSIYEAVENCIEEANANQEVLLYIHPTTLEVLVADASSTENDDLTAYEKCDWKTLIFDGAPDVDAINTEACNYCFVR